MDEEHYQDSQGYEPYDYQYHEDLIGDHNEAIAPVIIMAHTGKYHQWDSNSSWDTRLRGLDAQGTYIVHATHAWGTSGDLKGDIICQEDTMVLW